MSERNSLVRASVVALLSAAALLLLGLLTLPTQPRAVAGPATHGGPLALTGATLFDGQRWHAGTTLLIDDGLIADMGQGIPVPAGTQRVSAQGQFIVPGLIDAHTHTVGPALEDSLRFGVTTNLDMFAPASLLARTRAARDEHTATREADLFSAGVLATVDGGHGTQFAVPVDLVTGADDAANWVARRLDEGSDYIKLVYMPYQTRLPSLDLASASALIDAAHAAGVLAVAHISSRRGARDMLDAGIDGLVHIFADEPVSDAFIADARAADLFVIPTLTVFATADRSGEGAALADDADLAPFLRPSQSASLKADFGFKVPGMTLAQAIDNTRRLHAGGVTVLAGSDAPNPGTTHGASLHHELQLLQRAGLSPDDALAAATAQPAARFDLGTRGRLTRGARADFLILAADPRSDLQATRQIVAVYKNGASVDRELDSASEAAEAMPQGALHDFSEGNRAPDGYAWSATDDSSFGGKSHATLRHLADVQALRVDVSVRPGFAFPWAGIYFGASDDGPRSLREANVLRLRLRGTPGPYRIMFFNAGSMGAPPTVNINLGADWQDLDVALDRVDKLERDRIAGFAIVAGPTPFEGHFELAGAELLR